MKKIIILYSSQYQEDINLVQTFYPKAKYVELPDNEFDTFYKKTFEIDQSLQRGNLIESLLVENMSLIFFLGSERILTR